MSKRDEDGRPGGGEDVEDDTEPVTIIGLRNEPAIPIQPELEPEPEPESEAGSETAVWSRGAAPALLPDVEAEAPVQASAPVPTPSAPAPVAAPVAAPAAAPAPAAAAAPAPPIVAKPTIDPLSEAPTVVGVAAADPTPRSTIAPSSSLHAMLLERVDPSLGRGERIRLDAAHWRVSLGRADQNDVQLYTATASREHAVIAGNESGDWVITPAPGKSVKIDGEACSNPVVLEVGMNLILGTDHFRCVAETLVRPDMTAQTAADGFSKSADPSDFRQMLRERLGGIGLTWWLIGGAALLGLGLIMFAVYGG